MDSVINKKNIIVTVLLLIVALVSIFGISKVASSVEFHKNTIKSLDDKKIIVMELTAATVGSATAIAAIPGDATLPLANQIMDLSGYLIIVIGVIFFEKILLTLTGYITFTFLIPIACLLYGIYIYVRKDSLRNLSLKLAMFGIIIFMIVPVSVKISNLIEESYKATINQTIEEANELQNDVEDQEVTSEEGNGIWNKITSAVSNVVSSIGNAFSELIEKGKQLLSNFIDAIAVLLITTCVIPIAVLLFIIWVVKIIFDITIPVKKVKLNMPKFLNKAKDIEE